MKPQGLKYVVCLQVQRVRDGKLMAFQEKYTLETPKLLSGKPSEMVKHGAIMTLRTLGACVCKAPTIILPASLFHGLQDDLSIVRRVVSRRPSSTTSTHRHASNNVAKVYDKKNSQK